jgi:hypothetical protein
MDPRGGDTKTVVSPDGEPLFIISASFCNPGG